jgi:hypothetical protein
MIYIQKNTSNEIVLELSTALDASYTYFLFQFLEEWNTEKPSRYFTSPNVTPYISRFDQFNLVESETGATAQAVNDAPLNLVAGQYSYNVYASQTVIDINDLATLLATSPVQTGRMLVIGEDTVVPDVYQ